MHTVISPQTIRLPEVRRRRDRFGAGFADRGKPRRRKPGSTWYLDELFVTLRGWPYVLWRAVDEEIVEFDMSSCGILQAEVGRAIKGHWCKSTLGLS